VNKNKVVINVLQSNVVNQNVLRTLTKHHEVAHLLGL